MAWMSSLFAPGLASLQKKSFMECQMSSVGFKSGDSGGVFTQLIPSDVMQAAAAVC